MFQQGLWYKIKVQVLVQHSAILEVAAEIADHAGTILAHIQYGKVLKKPKIKDKNHYYIPYHRSDVADGNSGPVPMELGKTTLPCWTCGGPHY